MNFTVLGVRKCQIIFREIADLRVREVQRDSQQCQRASFQPNAQPPARATQLCCAAAQPAVRAGSAQLNPSVTLAVRARCG